ncbi:MAG: hypothetical protein IKJ73_04235 [Lachnospiraceae bacterium]|nr:hypothetical protein [Lachnospiraceae bacterium]
MKYYDLLVKATIDEDFYSSNEIILSIIKEDDSIEYVDNLLHFMEENPDVDYGMPGPLVHYMEKYYNNGYEELLYNSINRNPTVHTLWMLNRILNSPILKEKEKYFLLLKQVADNNESEIIKEHANMYLQYQMENRL